MLVDLLKKTRGILHFMPDIMMVNKIAPQQQSKLLWCVFFYVYNPENTIRLCNNLKCTLKVLYTSPKLAEKIPHIDPNTTLAEPAIMEREKKKMDDYNFKRIY